MQAMPQGKREIVFKGRKVFEKQLRDE